MLRNSLESAFWLFFHIVESKNSEATRQNGNPRWLLQTYNHFPRTDFPGVRVRLDHGRIIYRYWPVSFLVPLYCLHFISDSESIHRSSLPGKLVEFQEPLKYFPGPTTDVTVAASKLSLPNRRCRIRKYPPRRFCLRFSVGTSAGGGERLSRACAHGEVGCTVAAHEVDFRKP